ncbi:MAG: type IV pili methyl-accepting chemotaxis transducer N-terminal domain-containing protein, partial [Pseudomonadota bacterium]
MAAKGDSKSGASAGRTLAFLGLALGLSLLATVLMFYINAQRSANDTDYINRIGDQQVLSQEIAKLTSQASRGEVDAFPFLQRSRDGFEANLAWHKAQTPEDVTDALKGVEDIWAGYKEGVDTILQRQEVVSTMRENIQGINEQIPTLLALTDEVVTTLTEQNAPPDQIYIATRQLMLIQRIASNVSRVLEGGEGAVTAADRFGRDAALYGRVLDGMLRGSRTMRVMQVTEPTARKKLKEVSDLFGKISNQVGAILERSPEMFQVSDA